MDYRDAVAYLEAHARGLKPGLERMQFLCDLLDDPQHKAPAIHLTGTNGKGSTARMISSVLEAGGLSTGMFLSPYLQMPTEAFVLDGRPVTTDEFASLMTELVPYFELMERKLGEAPAYFEIKTTMALTAFANRGVDVAVIEVGLGGRWDATNVVDGQVAVVTNVDIEHTNYLGPDRVSIAREKAGIIKPGAVAITAETNPDVVDILEERCSEVDASLWQIGQQFDVVSDSAAVGGRLVSLSTPAGTYHDIFLPLHGSYQALNAACALSALEAFHGGALSEDLVQTGFGVVRSPGRLEVVGREPLVVLDVAHNPHGAAALGDALEDTFGPRPRIVVVAISEDKNRGSMLPHVVPGARVVATAADFHRAVPPEVLAKEAEEAGATSAIAVADVPSAVDAALAMADDGDLVLITGSVYSVGEARTHLVGPGPAL